MKKNNKPKSWEELEAYFGIEIERPTIQNTTISNGDEIKAPETQFGYQTSETIDKTDNTNSDNILEEVDQTISNESKSSENKDESKNLAVNAKRIRQGMIWKEVLAPAAVKRRRRRTKRIIKQMVQTGDRV